MKYLHKILKLKRGTKVKVHFSQPAKVMLLTDQNYQKYTKNLSYISWGGKMEKSPYIFEISGTGVWHVVIEKGYLSPINIVATVEILPSQ